MNTRLLTEPEAAEILRCSVSKVKRLRLAGRLAFVPGRPVLIDEADLVSYIQGAKRLAVAPAIAASSATKSSPTDEGAARDWALRAVMKKGKSVR